MDFIEVDGSYGSGGGQIIRTSVGLSAVTGKPCRIRSIRSGRPNPGLKAQHVKGIEAVAGLCDAHVSGLEHGSTEVEFVPGKVSAKPLDVDVGTAGSVTLVLQALLLPAIHSGKRQEFRVAGGTHVAWSPTTGYFRHVYCEYMQMMGAKITSNTDSYGYFPKGGGSVRVVVEPGTLKPISLRKREGDARLEAWSNASRELIKPRVAERQLEGLGSVLDVKGRNMKYVPTDSVGSSITAAASFDNCFLGSSALGSKGLAAEDVGSKAGSELKDLLGSGATVDVHMADQIIPYMAMAGGNSEVVAPELSDHTKTNIWVTEKFLGTKFKTEPFNGGFLISCSS